MFCGSTIGLVIRHGSWKNGQNPWKTLFQCCIYTDNFRRDNIIYNNTKFMFRVLHVTCLEFGQNYGFINLILMTVRRCLVVINVLAYFKSICIVNQAISGFYKFY